MPNDLNPVWLAQSRLRRRKLDECLEICTPILEKNPYDQATWYLKCRALTLKNWLDDTEIEEEASPGCSFSDPRPMHACMPL
jgi:tetratricopeptide repeat protein 8